MRARATTHPRTDRRSVLVPSVLALAGLCGLFGSIYVAVAHRRPPVARIDAEVSDQALESPPSAPAPAITAAREAAPMAAPVVPDDKNEAEIARIQKYLDSIYKKSDVISSFRTKFGEDIDCIDFYAQASVKSLIARGQPVRIPDISALPHDEIAPKPGVDDPLVDVAFNGTPDENGNPRKCFGMTVPMVRKSVEEIEAAGGLDAYLKRHGGKRAVAPPSPPPTGSAPVDDVGYMHAVATYSTGGSIGPIFGGEVTSYIASPALNQQPHGHSLAQTWTTSKGNVCTGSGSSSGCSQTVEMGWMVDNDMFNDANTHLFIFSTQDGYWSTGCYDGEACNSMAACDDTGYLEPCNGYTNGLEPNPVVLNPSSPWAPGMKLTASASGATVEVNFATWFLGGEWSLLVGNAAEGMSEMAFYPPDTWNGGAYKCTTGTCCPTGEPCAANGSTPTGLTIAAGAPLMNSAADFQTGGEVAADFEPFNNSNPASSNMGDGIGGASFSSAYMRNIELFLGPVVEGVPETIANNGVGPWLNFSSTYVTDMNCYAIGYGYNSKPQTISVKASDLGYTLLQYPGETPTSYVSPSPGVSGPVTSGGWGTYLDYGGLGFFTGFPFSYTDPNGGQSDFCCSTTSQNGVGNDTQCNQGD
jgi:hypothetical protein